MTQTPGQRTAGNVIDLIDGAVGDYLSPDAMRWTSGPSDAYEQWLNPPPAVRAALEAQEAALILAQFPRPEARAPVRRRPVIEAAREGRQQVPFVGGPWANDLRAMPLPLRDRWMVMPEPDPSDWLYTDGRVDELLRQPIAYTLRSATGQMGDMPQPATWKVYAVDGATPNELEAAIIVAFYAGWRP